MTRLASLMIYDSVGVGGANLAHDVRTICELLNRFRRAGEPPLPITGHADEFLFDRIRRFQYYHVGLLHPDGRIDPNGRTIRRLNELDEPPWLRIARAEMGVQEIRGDRHNPRVVEYLNTLTNIAQQYRDQDETAWCSAFVNWCMIRAGHAGTNHGLASSWRDWGFPLTDPRPGAVTVLRRIGASSDSATGSTTGYHVSFFVEGQGQRIRLLGGNQGGGLRVQESNYSLGAYRVEAYRWPTAPDAI